MQVLDLTRRTRQLLPHVVLSVTVPHTLPLDEQVGRTGESFESNYWNSTQILFEFRRSFSEQGQQQHSGCGRL